MSRSLSHRKSSLKVTSTVKEPSGPVLQFRWSVSAAKFELLDHSSSTILPSIDTDRSQQKLFAPSSFLTDRNSANQSSIFTQKSSSLPSVTKKNQSRMSTDQEKSSNDTPLSLTYTQLHHVPVVLPAKRSSRARLSIYSISADKRNSMSFGDSKHSMTSISVLSTTVEHGFSNDNLVRLRTAQLRRLNVSEKYLNEAKKLYFNAECRSFIPRLSKVRVS